MTRYFIDTEFIEAVDFLQPISIGIVDNDGREFYAINSEFDVSKADAWLQENVIAKLPPRTDPAWMSRADLARKLRAFVHVGKTTPEFWAYFAAYDWVNFCWLMGGRMIDLPTKWPKHCLDLKQSMVEKGLTKSDLPARDVTTAHDALTDAKWLAKAYGKVFNDQSLCEECSHPFYEHMDSDFDQMLVCHVEGCACSQPL